MDSRNNREDLLFIRFLTSFVFFTSVIPHAQGNGIQAIHGCVPGSGSNCLASTAHSPLFDCPAGAGFYADAFNCSFYYQCGGDLHYGCVCPCPIVNSNGIITQHYFNNASNVCVAPSLSNCVPLTTTSLTTSATTSATTSTTPTTSPTTSTTTATTQTSSDGSGSSNYGPAALAISIIVGLGLIALAIGLLVFFLKWRKKQQEGDGHPSDTASQVGGPPETSYGGITGSSDPSHYRNGDLSESTTTEPPAHKNKGRQPVTAGAGFRGSSYQ